MEANPTLSPGTTRIFDNYDSQAFEKKYGRTPDGRYFYKRLAPGELRNLRDNRPALDSLAQIGRAPFIHGLEESAGTRLVFMEPIDGPTLKDLTDSSEEKYSLGLAQDFAQLSAEMAQRKLFQQDTHRGNFILNTRTGQTMVTDLDSIVANQGQYEPGDYVHEHSETLAAMYLGEEVAAELEGLEEEGELQRYMPNTWEEFQWQRQLEPHDSYLFVEFASEPVGNILRETSVASRVDPRLLDFVLRGLNPHTCPDTFDELLQME